MKDKKKGPAAVKQTDPKRMSELKRLLKFKQKELESQEAKLFMEFTKTYPSADLTLNVAEGVWAFIGFLKKSGYRMVDEKTVFCMPFSHMVDYSRLL